MEAEMGQAKRRPTENADAVDLQRLGVAAVLWQWEMHWAGRAGPPPATGANEAVWLVRVLAVDALRID